MSIAYWCILIAALLPYVWVGLAKAGGGYDNHNPRIWMAAQQDPRRQRAYAAHQNAFEAFAPFAAAVLMAQFAGVSQAHVTALSVAFVALRILHGLLYMANAALMRSLTWLAALSCVLVLMAQAAYRLG